MERQRVAIDEHNKQYYECKKRKDQEQSARKLVDLSFYFVCYVFVLEKSR